MAYCTKCGKEVVEGSAFCQNCGEKLSYVQSSSQSSPTKSQIIDENYTTFIGKNADKYLTKFKKFNLSGVDKFSATWHWPAFFVPFFWMLHRKLYWWALLVFLMGIIPYVGFLAMVVFGMTGNYIYYKHTKKKLLELKLAHPSSDIQRTINIARAGGVNNVAVVLAPILLIAVIGILAAIAIPAYLGMQERARKGVVIRAAFIAEPELQAWLKSSLKSGAGAVLREHDTDGNNVIDTNDLTNSELAATGVCAPYVTMRNTSENLKSPWSSITDLWITTGTGNGQISCVQFDDSITLTARNNRGTVVHSKTITSY